jgi:hypothetical protein
VKTSNISNIRFTNFIGVREIEFDENEKVLLDTFKKFVMELNRDGLENRERMDDEIRESIVAGYTEIQKQLSKKWELKLPEKLEDETDRKSVV